MLHESAHITITELPVGPWEGPLRDDTESDGNDLLVVVSRGFVMRESLISGGRGALQLFGPEDVLPAQHRTEEARGAISWWALTPLRLNLVDVRALSDAAEHRVVSHLLRRAERQLDDAAHQQAILQLPRVEDRLVALFWLFARRWGRATPDGALLDVSLRHDVIGRLVGAKRSTVSWGLAQLARRGLLRELDGGVLLAFAGDPDAELDAVG